jgi:hypothetical protein
VVRTPPNSTAALLAALQPLIDMGLTPDQAYALGMGRFPVAGLANFSDDWLEPRFDGGFHFHHGTDVFAPGGTPIRSPADGILRLSSDTLGGTTVYVTEPDGTYYYMAHLSAYVQGQVSGQQVHIGDIIGFVGNSGDAQGGATHCHFEVHPNGGGPVDPKPYLDQWLADALAAAPQLIASVRAARSPQGLVPAAPELQAIPNLVMPAPGQPAVSELLWASAANPQGGPLQLAEAAAATAVRSIDWTAEQTAAQQVQTTAAVDRQRLLALTSPLAPLGLRALVDPPQHITFADARDK